MMPNSDKSSPFSGNPARKIKRLSSFWNDGNRQAQQQADQAGARALTPLPPAEDQLKPRFIRQLAIGAATGTMPQQEALQRCEQAHEHTAGAAFDDHIAARKGQLVQAQREAQEAQGEADEAKTARDQRPKLRRKAFDADGLHKKPYNPSDVVEMLLMLAAVIVSMILGINTVAYIMLSDFGFSQSIGRARAYGAVLFILPTFAIATFSGLTKDDAKRQRLIRAYILLGAIGLFGFIIFFSLAKTPLPPTVDPLDLSLEADSLEGLSPEPWWKTWIQNATEFINDIRPLLNLPLMICMALSEIFFAISVKSILLRKLEIHGWPYRSKAEITPEYAALDTEYRTARQAAVKAAAAVENCEEALRQVTERKRRYCEEVKALALADFMARYAEVKTLQSAFE